MKALHRKLLRDLVRLKGQVLSIALVAAAGISVYLAAVSTYESLVGAQRAYYAESRFADVFASLKRAPSALEARLRALPGVSEAETRVVQDVPLDLDGVAEPVSGRILSLPENGPTRLNRLSLRRGRFPDPARPGEVLVGEAFAGAHRLVPGRELHAVLNGRKQRLTVVGIALTPEYVYSIQPGGFVPDDRHFGILWMGRESLASAFDLTGAFNDVSLLLAPGASREELLRRVDRLLEPYGGLGAYGREDQASHRYLSDELKQLKLHAVTVPATFLLVAGFLLNVVMARLVATERTQIATLKALGYPSGRVAAHYLAFASCVVLIGSALGVAGGLWMGSAMTRLYTQFFRFPVLAYRMEAWVPLSALALSLAAGAAGALGSVRRVLALAPAEALQPPAPLAYRHGWLARSGLLARLSRQARMVIRSVARRPLRAVLGSLGIAFATSILVMGSFWQDTLRYLMQVQFSWIQREDVAVGFGKPVPARTARSLGHLPGVQAVEGLRAVPVVLRAGPLSRRTALLGLEADGRMHALVDPELRRIPIPAEGLLLSQKLGEKLRIGAGDTVQVEVREGLRRVREAKVARLVEEMVGFSAYMDRRAVNRLMGEGDTLSGALLARDAREERALFAALKETPGIASATPKLAALRSLQKTLAQLVLVFTFFLTGFAAIIVVGVVYNCARILLSERARELASLRVLGFSHPEIFRLFLWELVLQLALGIPAGLLLGYGLARVLVPAEEPEAFRLPVVIEAGTFVRVALSVAAAGACTALLARRQLRRLDLVSVLKTRE